MSAWSNIIILKDDPEIIEIDKIEKKFGELPPDVKKIRELITRFEVCHFKYKKHIEYIKAAIMNLKAGIEPEKIGESHIRNGENAWKKDKTGRSLFGQKYVWALKNWLDETGLKYSDERDYYDGEIEQKVKNSLGKKNQEKERLVRLLTARLLWDWESYEKLLKGKGKNKNGKSGELEELESQVCRMDICHYDFPKNLDLLLKGIGKLKPAPGFFGCGSFSPEIKKTVEKEYLILIKFLESVASEEKQGKDELMKAWLSACFAKTLKEQAKL